MYEYDSLTNYKLKKKQIYYFNIKKIFVIR